MRVYYDRDVDLNIIKSRRSRSSLRLAGHAPHGEPPRFRHHQCRSRASARWFFAKRRERGPQGHVDREAAAWADVIMMLIPTSCEATLQERDRAQYP